MTAMQQLINYMVANFHLTDESHIEFAKAIELEKQQIIDTKKQLLKDISAVFLNEENLKKCDKISDRDVLEAVGETIVNFPI
jgi:ABC-type branched-subunit amino acid transport system ATPase component